MMLISKFTCISSVSLMSFQCVILCFAPTHGKLLKLLIVYTQMNERLGRLTDDNTTPPTQEYINSANINSLRNLNT